MDTVIRVRIAGWSDCASVRRRALPAPARSEMGYDPDDSDRYPRGWLFQRRWGKNPRAMTMTGERIRHITVGGRTTAWVPACQR